MRKLSLLAGAALLALAPRPLRAQEAALYLEGGLGHKQGDFGTPILSKLTFGYGTLGYASPTFDLSLTVPYLGLETRGNGQDATSSGMGDLLLRGVQRFVPETPGGFAFDGGLALKLPTANRDKGLGTGQTDVGGFLTLHQRWGRIQASLLGGWIQSSAAEAGSNPSPNRGLYSAGFALAYLAEGTKVSVSYEARGAHYPDTSAPRELSLDLFTLLSARLALRGSFAAGLNDGAPRTSFGLGLVYWP